MGENTMREIKFRAYSRTHKKMVYRNLHDKNWYYTPKNDEHGCHTAFGVHQSDHHTMPIMQFTGKSDKNGKDMYEGDICRNTANKDISNKVVVFDEYSSGFGLLSKDLDINGDEEVFFIREAYPGNEVIGNIYENPELNSES